MSRNAKIILLVIVLLAIIAGVVFLLTRGGADTDGAGGFLGFFGGGTLPPTSGSGTPPPGGAANVPPGGTLPISDTEKSKLIQLSRDPTIGIALAPQEARLIYFKLGQGHLYSTAYDGEGGEQLLSNFTMTDVVEALWSYDSTYAIVKMLVDPNSKYKWVHLTGTSTIEYGDLGGQILSADFASSENRIASIVAVNNSILVRTSSPDGSGVRSVGSIPLPDADIYWHRKDTLSLKTKTSGFAQSILQTMTLAGRSSVLEAEKYGYDLIWNADGTQYLAMETDSQGKNLALSLHNQAASTVSTLTFKTLPEKCLFSQVDPDILYCAIPASNIGDTALPDWWWQGKIQFSDMLWKINMDTGENTLLLEGGGFDITQLLLSPNENYIFFINKKDSALWSLKLL